MGLFDIFREGTKKTNKEFDYYNYNNAEHYCLNKELRGNNLGKLIEYGYAIKEHEYTHTGADIYLIEDLRTNTTKWMMIPDLIMAMKGRGRCQAYSTFNNQELSNNSKVVDEGIKFIDIIHECNEYITDEEMSKKLDKLEELIVTIFYNVKKDPKLEEEVDSLLTYYLPTIQKLLVVYMKLIKQSDTDIKLKNVEETKIEIEKSIDVLNEAFKNMLNDLLRDKVWDIQSDISVLNTMLKQDGYSESDFDLFK